MIIVTSEAVRADLLFPFSFLFRFSFNLNNIRNIAIYTLHLWAIIPIQLFKRAHHFTKTLRFQNRRAVSFLSLELLQIRLSTNMFKPSSKHQRNEKTLLLVGRPPNPAQQWPRVFE